jgi:hypothetical protein
MDTQRPANLRTALVRADSGQAAVETAITMPLFVFIILGSLQLGLMNQARLLTKYAAYKAVRTGALRSVDMSAMEQAALSVLLPMVSYEAGGGQELMFKTTSAGEFQSAMQQQAVMDNRMPEASDLKIAQVVICGPTKDMLRDGTVRTPGSGDEEYDFDDARNAANNDWRLFERTKLFVQVTFNYRMSVPFANMMMYLIARGQEKADLMWVARMSGEATRHFTRDYENRDPYDRLARDQHIYVLPIRAQFGMRMQSNLFPSMPGHELPAKFQPDGPADQPQCIVPFPKKNESEPPDPGGGMGGTVGDDPDKEVPPE